MIEVIFSIAILVMSVVIHEVSHGYTAESLGDPTARYAGRLTLNPIKHIDPIGSVIIPIILAIIPPHTVFGWAKPVPVNPYNFRNQKWGEVLVAVAGPLSNLSIALIFGLLIRFGIAYQFVSESFVSIGSSVVIINLLLGVFNLVPLAPLDGSKVLFGVLPYRFQWIRDWLESNFVFSFLIFIFFMWQFIEPVIAILFHLITGL